MYIKAVVLDNFKSFGRKTKIPFYQDFTVVTGPNGSGKSNIIDAVLFALGLARTRGIRAEKLTDLIYNPGHEDGSSSSGPREATVEVVLDNGDGTLSRSQIVNAAGSEDVGDVDEIRIRRRVKETEDNYYSYYYLNDRSVNLSDIQDLLAQAGVTPEGYNVVMQGDVTEIINMTPHARREIIDEIAGVAEFDAKKEDAFEELEVVEERIDEAELRIEEKRDRLAQLEDERRTAMRYRRLRREKEEYESFKKASELEEKVTELETTQENVAELEDELADRQRELDEREGRVVRLQEDLEDLNAEIERKGEDEQLRIKSEIEEIKGEISRLEDKIEASEEAVDEAESDRREAFVQIDRKQETIEELEEEMREHKLEKASIKTEIQERREEKQRLEAEIEAVDTEFDELKTELTERKSDLEDAKTEKNDLQREQDRLLDEARRRSNAIDEKAATIEEKREQIPELESHASDLERELEKAAKNRANIADVVDDLTEKKRRIQSEIDDLDDEIQAKQQEYAELEAKANESGDSSFGRAVTTILNSGRDGVHGAVAQLGSVPGEYAVACETAAGGRLANVVVDDDVVGQQCIEHLKSRNAGRATFLPLTDMSKRRLPSKPSDPGVVDFAYNLVDFDGQYEGVFSYVLGDTLVVEDIETARSYMGDYRMVTLDGDLVEKSGAMTGGSGGGSRYSFTDSGEGKLERVAKQITDLQEERESLRDDFRDIESRLDDARDRKTDAADEVRSIESEIESIADDRESIESDIESLESDLDDLEAERESVDERMNEIAAEIDEKTDEIEEIEGEIAELETELEDSKIPELTEQIEELEAEIDEREDRIADIDGDLNELSLEKEYAEDAIEDLHDDIETAQNRKAKHEERIAEYEDRIAEKREALEEKREAVEELEAELAELKEDRSELKEDLAEARKKRDEQQSRVDTVESKLEGERERVSDLEWEIESLEDEVGDYDPEDVPDHETVLEMIDLLQADMEAMEPVNMLAIDEYDEVREELEELEDGKATLVEEAEEIRSRIEQYETQKKETFMDSYDAISGQFTEIFERLSEGTGSLHLENQEDPFDGGLTMRAQPGDKPIQRLDAMSGGEKSLTALAFIFAIQRHNPAPFYALDEVDAFLDAVNAERIGQMVEELAGEAQFVVVSHRSAMLDRSERAIGVTMQEDNVSAVTGIDLSDDADADAEEVPVSD
ncbi:chromosome segregation protein SMC [Natronobacterium gregoryi]|uniref:Chromosome partition protein Smc n=2 Tax=Natronobacterium gregoryi TaxID=44930 RepID=L0AJU3_NATGS|nr:chromosome segregation protein SMC [Natronobacterium gregoryi]AFZ74143.1 chromosome segregation protein SMC [Natronobacterium gregoryi SP2]ELY63880.1 chromosome segregation protein SMC [Natronobacterium gregoryi SP2]PLK22063.1 chromosome segregation protein SMC [Natronobacterium gregoryi SP2]SFI50245.1 condensin subunit Smc [Natronobacterium gregoryi]